MTSEVVQMASEAERGHMGLSEAVLQKSFITHTDAHWGKIVLLVY